MIVEIVVALSVFEMLKYPVSKLTDKVHYYWRFPRGIRHAMLSKVKARLAQKA